MFIKEADMAHLYKERELLLEFYRAIYKEFKTIKESHIPCYIYKSKEFHDLMAKQIKEVQ